MEGILLEKIKTAGNWIVLAATVSIFTGVGYLAWKNQKWFEYTVVANAQAQLLSTAKSTGYSLENFFKMQQGMLKSIATDPILFKKLHVVKKTIALLNNV